MERISMIHTPEPDEKYADAVDYDDAPTDAEPNRVVYAVADPDGGYVYISDAERDALPEELQAILAAVDGRDEWPSGSTYPAA